MSVTRDQIINGLNELGVKAGAVLLVHSSLSSFGRVDGGADTVIDALLAAVGPTGTIMVPTLSFRSFDETNPRFDARETPSGTGLITEVFRKRPNAIRSLHPVSSVAAIGPQAKYLTARHDDTPCSFESPYGRIYQLGGASLFLGAPLSTNSVFHTAEEIASPDYMIYKEFQNVRMVRADGSEFTHNYRRYICAVTRHIDRMEQVFIDRGVLHEARIGNARCVLLPAKQNVDITVEILKTNPSFITNDS